MKIYHDGSFTRKEIQQMIQGKLLDRNGKRYGLCKNCKQIIRLDKPLFGGLHFCDAEE